MHAPPAQTPDTAGPLAGVRIVEFAADGPVPFCGMLFADYGADVLRIERPGRGALPFAPPQDEDALLSNRPALTLDLKSPAGVADAWRLLECADVLIEGCRPGVMERLGLGPAALEPVNPRLVYGRATGWGQSGPYAHRPGHDLNFLSISGALNCIGPPDGAPAIPLNLIGDFGGGGMFLALGVLCALWESRRSGRGQVVDAAMIDGVSALLASVRTLANRGAWRERRGANVLDGGAPWYAVYPTRDDKYVAIASVEPPFFRRLITELGLDARFLDSQFDERQWPALRDAIGAALRTRTRAQWCAQLDGQDLCFSPVLNLAEAAANAHLHPRQTTDLQGRPRHGPAPRFGRSTAADTAKTGKSATRTADDILLAWGIKTADPQRR